MFVNKDMKMSVQPVRGLVLQSIKVHFKFSKYRYSNKINNFVNSNKLNSELIHCYYFITGGFDVYESKSFASNDFIVMKDKDRTNKTSDTMVKNVDSNNT